VAWFQDTSAVRSAYEPDVQPPTLTLARERTPRVALCGGWDDVRDLCGLLSEQARVTWYGDPQAIGQHDLIVYVESRHAAPGAFAWLREIRAGATPILVVTRGDSPQAGRLLALGVAGCIQSSAGASAILSRVLGLASGGSGTRPAAPPLRIEVDSDQRTISVGDTVAHVTRTELLIFDYLVHHAERWKTATEVLEDVLGNCHCHNTPVVRVHVFRLRRALGDKAWCIESHQGKGYRFTLRLVSAQPWNTAPP
jgi:DNA-binding response OmpR family regulator